MWREVLIFSIGLLLGTSIGFVGLALVVDAADARDQDNGDREVGVLS